MPIALHGTVSRSLSIGRALNQGDIEKALQDSHARIFLKGKLHTARVQSRNGFLQGWVQIGGYRIWIKNENIALYKEKKRIIAAPDALILCTKKNGANT